MPPAPVCMLEYADLLRVDRSLQSHGLLGALWSAVHAAVHVRLPSAEEAAAILLRVDPYHGLVWVEEHAHFTHLRTALDGAVEGTPGTWSIQVCVRRLHGHVAEAPR